MTDVVITTKRAPQAPHIWVAEATYPDRRHTGKTRCLALEGKTVRHAVMRVVARPRRNGHAGRRFDVISDPSFGGTIPEPKKQEFRKW